MGVDLLFIYFILEIAADRPRMSFVFDLLVFLNKLFPVDGLLGSRQLIAPAVQAGHLSKGGRVKTAIVLAIVLFACPVLGAPFLVCDPGQGVTLVGVEVDGQTTQTPYPLHYDLEGLEPGPHKIRARFKFGVWGWSDWSDPLSSSKPLIIIPTGVGLSAD